MLLSIGSVHGQRHTMSTARTDEFGVRDNHEQLRRHCRLCLWREQRAVWKCVSQVSWPMVPSPRRYQKLLRDASCSCTRARGGLERRLRAVRQERDVEGWEARANLVACRARHCDLHALGIAGEEGTALDAIGADEWRHAERGR